MTTHKNASFIAMLMLTLTFTAQAQSTSSYPSSSLIAAFVPDAPVGVLAEFNVAAANDDALSDLSMAQAKNLTSPNGQTREEALQNIIFFATNHSEDVNFKPATLDLYDIYRFDRDEDHRIMALVAIHAIGSENVMRHISQRVKLEKSARVRRYTQAALRDYFEGHTR